MRKKVKYSKRRGEAVASLAHPKTISKFHVIVGESKWSVVKEGSTKALRSFSTANQAIDYAKEIAAEKTGEVVVHEESGFIKDRVSFL
jgi:hypothetical protein